MTNNDLTELVFILDRSGSMAGLASDTIGGFNAMLAKQKAEPGQALVTTVLFDHETVTIHDRLKIAQVPEMTAREYSVRGSTALLDAVGRTVEHIAAVHRYIRPEDVPRTSSACRSCTASATCSSVRERRGCASSATRFPTAGSTCPTICRSRTCTSIISERDRR